MMTDDQFERLIERLTRLALNRPSPHVRRIAPLIRIVGAGLRKAGHQIEPRVRYVSLDGGAFRAKYVHPDRSPRQRGACRSRGEPRQKQR